MMPTSIALPANQQHFQAIAIAGVTDPVVGQYFQTLNAGEFEATAQLFAEDGFLQPPFEDPVVGPAAIATYLQSEAAGLTLIPHHGTSRLLDNGCAEYEVTGTVKTPWFSVNICWQFILSPWQEIFVVRVKLLASLRELLRFRQVKDTL